MPSDNTQHLHLVAPHPCLAKTALSMSIVCPGLFYVAIPRLHAQLRKSLYAFISSTSKIRHISHAFICAFGWHIIIESHQHLHSIVYFLLTVQLRTGKHESSLSNIEVQEAQQQRERCEQDKYRTLPTHRD